MSIEGAVRSAARAVEGLRVGARRSRPGADLAWLRRVSQGYDDDMRLRKSAASCSSCAWLQLEKLNSTRRVKGFLGFIIQFEDATRSVCPLSSGVYIPRGRGGKPRCC
jgi:hypothetical protein